MEEQNLSENIQEVAELEENVVDTSEQNQEVAEPETQTENSAENTENNTENNAETKNESRDYERDSAYARMRRENADKQKELEALKAEKDKLVKALGQFGFNGNTVDDQIDQANAYYTGRNVEDIRKERIAQAEKEAEQKKLQEELEYYRKKSAEEKMAADFKEIQKLDPTIKSWSDMPQAYYEKIKQGYDGVDAFMSMRNREYYEKFKKLEEEQNAAKMQANAKASVGSAGSGEVKETLTYADMSDAEFEKLLAKVKRGEMTSIT